MFFSLLSFMPRPAVPVPLQAHRNSMVIGGGGCEIGKEAHRRVVGPDPIRTRHMYAHQRVAGRDAVTQRGKW